MGLVQSLTAHQGKNSFACLRQPSQGKSEEIRNYRLDLIIVTKLHFFVGPTFGIKGKILFYFRDFQMLAGTYKFLNFIVLKNKRWCSRRWI